MVSEANSVDSNWAEALVRNATRRMAFGAEELARNVGSLVSGGRLAARALGSGGRVLVCGNGGSAASAQHFAAEFTGKLSLDRAPYAAIALSVDTSAITAIANDYGYADVFARQVNALGRPGDVLVGISTSGSSQNVVAAMSAANRIGMSTISLTGPSDGLGGDVSITVTLRETARIQEIHDLVLHEIAQIAERILVPELADDASADRFPYILTESGIPTFRDWMQRSGQSLVTTNGVFDLLHEGHRFGLAAARRHGDRLVVLLNSDQSVRGLKGPSRPIRNLDSRLADLAPLPCVDHVVVMDDPDPRRLLGLLRPTIHFKGSEYRDVALPEAAVVQQNGGRIEYIERVEGQSTTAQVERIASAHA